MARFDVAVVGPGPVGLTAAIALAQAGLATCLVGPAPARNDGRTAALLEGSVALLEGLGLWTSLASQAGPLRTLRIVDDTDSLFRPPPASFEAAEIGLEAFGWNVENAALSAALVGAARAQAGLHWIEMPVTQFEAGDAARLHLPDGAEVEAELVVAADGRRSRVRADAGIASSERMHPQAAFTTLIRHEMDHGDASTEFHTRSGPFTLVPLPGRRSSLVWVTQPRHAERLAAADLPDLEKAIAIASHGILGRIEAGGPRGVVRLVSMSVESCIGPRLALVGEAAHVMPPIGAQGLNLGFADVRALVDVVIAEHRAGRDLGGLDPLARYDRERRPDIRLRSGAVDGLNSALLSAWLPVDFARGIALGALSRIGPLRRAAMRAGLPRRASTVSAAGPTRHFHS